MTLGGCRIEFPLGVTEMNSKELADASFNDFVKLHIEGHAVSWNQTNSPTGKFESASVHHYMTCVECSKGRWLELWSGKEKHAQ